MTQLSDDDNEITMIQYTGHEDFLRQLTVYPLILIIDYSVCTSDVDQRFDMQRPIQHTCVYMYESSQPTASQSPHNSTRSSARWTQYPNLRAGVRSVSLHGDRSISSCSSHKYRVQPQSTNPAPMPMPMLMPTPLSWPRPIALHLTGVVLHQCDKRHQIPSSPSSPSSPSTPAISFTFDAY